MNRRGLAPVPGGRFVMGSADIREAEAPNPPHEVEVDAFQLAIHPVTNEEYRQFIDATGARAPTGFHDARFEKPLQPVVGMSWDEALAYCTWAGGTLPTEAQWERAARGNNTGFRYPWGDDEPDEPHAHFADDWNAGGPREIGGRVAGVGPFGHHDLAGNVWEWCLDSWSPDAHLQRSSSSASPPPLTSNSIRPLRGGCWRSIAPKLQSSYRNWSHRLVRHVTIGLRLCAPVK